MSDKPALPDPVAWKWRHTKNGSDGMYWQHPSKYGIRMDSDLYEWTALHSADQLRAALATQAEAHAAELAERLNAHNVVIRLANERAEQIREITAELAEAREQLSAHDAIRAGLEAERDALRADAERYRWLRELQCNSLTLSHNDEHACNYMTAADWIDEHPDDFRHDDPAEVQRIKETNTIWTLQIYPDTPVGFNWWHGSTPDAVIDAARTGSKP